MRLPRYPRQVERQMKALYESLSEKDRRRYAAIEATKLGYGGPSYMKWLLGADYKTLARGRKELVHPPELPPGRIRKKGGT
jgi:hypothetical protein